MNGNEQTTADSGVFETLKELAKEVGAEFRGVEGDTLVFAIKRPEDESSVRAMAQTIFNLLLTSEELKGLIDQYPKIALR